MSHEAGSSKCSSKASSKHSVRKPSGHRHTLSLQKTEIIINVYDLLPPSKLTSVLWTLGTALHHSGVVINSHEYAYGGHTIPNKTGVYYTTPRTLPSAQASFRTPILQGYTFLSQSEIDTVLEAAAKEWCGTDYNLLSRNCNHFTSYLCQKLTARAAPGWLNRAAGIGASVPCIVPREWLSPITPDVESGGGDLLADSDDDSTETSNMLRHVGKRSLDDRRYEPGGSRGHRMVESYEMHPEGRVRDSSGRTLPSSEVAPTPHRLSEVALYSLAEDMCDERFSLSET